MPSFRHANPPQERLLEAGISVFRTKGHAASTVDDICAEAGVTKGSFFHHFRSKEELVLGSVAHWRVVTEALFASAPYQQFESPRARILGYIDFRLSLLERPVPAFTCLLGTLVQETYLTHPAVRAACDAGMSAHIEVLARDLEAARLLYAPKADWSARSAADFIQAVLQGSFIFAKSRGDAAVVRANLGHLRQYIEWLLPVPAKQPTH